MKSLILMNPVKRRRSRRARSGGTVARSTRRRARRSVRRNPTVKVRRSRHHSPAMRRKISLAVKRANRLRASGGGRRRSVAVIRTAPRRSLRRRSVSVARRSARRSFRRFSGGGGGISIKSLLSKDILMTASGAISASFLTTWLLRTYGSKLPMANTLAGRVGYKLAIPFAGAYVANKFLKQRQVAQGMLIGGVVMAINEIIANFNRPAGAVAGVGGYAGPADYASQMIDGMNEGEFMGEDPDGMGEYFDAPVDPLYASQSAFPESAFAGN